MEKKIKIIKNGPFEVYGNIPLDAQEIITDNKGYPLNYKKIKDYSKQEFYQLCRCGNSSAKPFCDGSHIRTKFDGTQNAGMNNYSERADTLEGNNLTLKDDISLCSGAGFCRGREGNTWDLIQSKNKNDNKIAINQCHNCPSGRLVAFDKNKPLEPKFKPHISILYEPWKKVGGSIWVKGNIPIINEENKAFEVRNRVTLCRCGRSTNKPFCDSTHRYIDFKDEQ